MPKSIVENIDCMERLRDAPDNHWDLCLTDPPYGVNLDYASYDDSPANWVDLMNRFIPEAKRSAKMVIMPSCRIRSLEWIYTNYPPDWLIIWHKGSPGTSAYVGFNDYEPLLVYGKTANNLQMHDHFTLIPNVKMGEFRHPCPKPIGWSKWLMRRALPKGGSVVDPFLGSGSSRIAAYDLGFDFTGYELDADYFEAQEKRFAAHIAQANLFAPASIDLGSTQSELFMETNK